MKIAIDFSFYNKLQKNYNSSKFYINPEITLAEIGFSLLKKLTENGFDTVNCSPKITDPTETAIDSIINSVNLENPNLFISLNLNSFSNGTKNGIEIWVKNKEDSSYKKAKQIQNRFIALGYKPHSIKTFNNFSPFNSITCPVIIINCFYGTNNWDCKRYNKDLIAEAIFKALIKKDNFLLNYNFISC
ncbi:MAG: N-acetylmuramoyl-L-alanine amidase [Sarcina sp.]